MQNVTGILVVIGAALCCFAFALLSAFEESNRRRRATRNIARLAKQALGDTAGTPPLYVYDAASGLIVTDKSVQAIDLCGEGSLLQTYELSHITALKVYEDKSHNMAFRLVTRHRSETRLIRLQGAVSITQLFDRLSGVGVDLDYVPEES